MKSTNRIHRNGGTKARSLQPKIRRAEKPSAQPVRIVINDEGGKPFAEFEIPRAFYAAMQRDAQAKGISMMQWIEDASRAAMENHQPAAIDFTGIEDKLDEAVLMSNAMSELLCRALFAEPDGGSCGGCGTRLRSGIALLVMEAHVRLERVAKAVEVAAYPKREVAA